MKPLLAVYQHEMRRSLTAGRITWWFIMTGFPVVITICLRSIPDFARGAGPEQLDSIWSILLYVLVPCVACGLCVLLTAAPAVATELEQRTWVYLATRPHGIMWLLAGKFLVAVTWGVTAGIISTCMTIPLTTAVSRLQISLSMAGLSVMSSISYSAVFLLLGTINHKRSMLICVAYTGLIELVLGVVPALVNRLTVQYRLRSLLLSWVPMDRQIRENSSAFGYVSDNAWWPGDCLWLLMQSAVLVAAAIAVAHYREFTTASEGDL